MYANWLCNNKGSDRSAFLNGAYDVSTFGFTPGGIFTDQLTHNPGAQYWIPTWDEWLKAAHYDPNKLNTDGTRGGWWKYSNGSDTPYVYGPPPSRGGTGTANSGYFNGGAFTIPLGSYAASSPWGLYDTAGATGEWTEGIRTLIGGDRYRIFEGSYWGEEQAPADLSDGVRFSGGAEFPHIPTYEFGVRIASAVPSPSTWPVVLGAMLVAPRRLRPGVSLGA